MIELHVDVPLQSGCNIWWEEITQGRYNVFAVSTVDLLLFLARYDSLRVENINGTIQVYATQHEFIPTRREPH